MNLNLSPSAAERWTRCAGSARLVATLPPAQQNPSTVYSDEGHLAHALAQEMLLGRSVEITPEMLDHLSVYTTAVRAALAEIPEAVLLVERKLPTFPGMRNGIIDATVIGRRTLRIFDLKYGAGVPVEVVENPQLLIYLSAAFRALAPIDQLGIDELVITIVQPRCPHPDGPVRTWTVPRDVLFRFEDALKDAIERAQSATELLTGPWCKFCPAKPVCPALRAETVALARSEFDVVPSFAPPAPATLSSEQLAFVLSRADLVEDWLSSVRAHVLEMLERGEDVPGWKLVPKRATRKWTDPDRVLAALQNRGFTPDQVFAPLELKSPAQMEKSIGKANVPADLVEKVSSGVTLAPEQDPRPAVPAGARHDFPALPTSSEV